MMILTLVLSSLDPSSAAIEPFARVVFKADRPTRVSTLTPAGGLRFLCTAPCTVELPIGSCMIATGGGDSGLIERQDVVIVRESGATVTLNNAPTWRRPTGIALLATGIPILAVGGPIAALAGLFAGFSSGNGGAAVAAPAVVGGVGIAAIVAGAALLGLSTAPGVVSF